MSRTPTLATVPVFHGDGDITLYHPGSDGVTVDESKVVMNSGPVDLSLEFQSFRITHLRHTLPLRNTLEYLGLPDPHTPDALKAAWENAEQSDKCHAGDVLITRLLNEAGGFKIAPARSSGRLNSGVTRILSRSPREPWQDLADILSTDNGEIIGEHRTIAEVAKALHERGVRVVGGDES